MPTFAVKTAYMKEIERKYLVRDMSFREMATERRHIEQGYLSRKPEATVRVRIADDKAYITVKGRNEGAVRDEWEYQIPVDDARLMLERCSEGAAIAKTRYVVPYAGFTWEVDVFEGALQGLIVAEIELPDADAVFAVPPFVGDEVTGDPRYFNSNLTTFSTC